MANTHTPGTLLKTIYHNPFLSLEEWQHPITKRPWYVVRVRLRSQDIEIFNHGQPIVLSIGILTEWVYLCYAEISPKKNKGDDAQTFGLACEGEQINRVWIPEAEFLSDTFVCEDLRVLTFRETLRRRKLEKRLAELETTH